MYLRIHKLILSAGLILLLMGESNFIVSAENLTLPVYNLTIDPAYLDSLEANPTSPVTYPAILTYENESYDCEICFRGASSLTLPKQSWRIIFDGYGPFGRKETFFNAEYRDISFCRNYLSMALAKMYGLNAPDMRHISFVVNGVFQGVHLEVEPVDSDFFYRRGLGENPYFKGVCHGARFSPLAISENWQYYYEPNSSTPSGNDTLCARLAFIQYGEPDSVAAHLDDIIDIQDFSAYFALQFSIHNGDGFTKNFYLYQSFINKYLIVPWDCDATFGNDWTGTYIGGTADLNFTLLNNQGIFQRLIGVPQYNTDFLALLSDMAAEGFDSLAQTLQQVYDEIRSDVYQDTFKLGSNEEFDNEQAVLLGFLNDRSQALANLDWFNRIEGRNYSANPAYISNAADSVLFTIEAMGNAAGCYLILDDISGAHTYSMYDNGLYGDSLAGDGVYSLKKPLTGVIPPVYYTFLIRSNIIESYPVPPAGDFDLVNLPMALPSVQLNPSPPQAGEISLGPYMLDEASGTALICLRNISNRFIDVSGCVVRTGPGCEFMILRELPDLAPGDTLFIANHIDIAQTLLPQSVVTGNLYFVPYAGDTVYLETFPGQILASGIVETITPIDETPGVIVINEINYNSDDEFNPGDWVELYAVSGTTNLHHWRFRDGRIDHVYYIPYNTILNAGEFLVLCSDTVLFRECFPDVTRIVGNWSFGLSASGDMARLYTSMNIMVDCVAFDDYYPWPMEPDGDGPTLELINPTLPNYNYENWDASEEPYEYGTPGNINSIYNSVQNHPGNIPRGFCVSGVYPNPFNSSIRIKFITGRPGKVYISIYNILGRTVKSLDCYYSTAGEQEISWDGRNDEAKTVSSGVYFIQTKFGEEEFLTKAVLIR